MNRRFPNINTVEHRPPVKGRLRMGKMQTGKNGKAFPTSVTEWIVTGSDKQALGQVAEIYGGTVEPFDNKKSSDTWRVNTTSSALNVVLPDDPFGGQIHYEFWAGRGLQRRCDGVVCTGYPEDGPPQEVDCVCNRKIEAAGLDYEVPDKELCAPKTRLSVILPDVSLGVWLLSTSSRIAHRELVASVELIQAVTQRGFPRAQLSIERRQADGGAKKFVVPVISSSTTFNELEAGHSRVALEAGTAVMESPVEIGVAEIAEIVDAETDEWAG